MMKNHHLSAAIANASWGTLISQLKYKCAWYGKRLIIIDPKNISRICHECKQRITSLTAFQSEWLAAANGTVPIVMRIR